MMQAGKITNWENWFGNPELRPVEIIEHTVEATTALRYEIDSKCQSDMVKWEVSFTVIFILQRISEIFNVRCRLNMSISYIVYMLVCNMYIFSRIR